MIKRRLIDNLPFIFFFPVYFTPGGLYKYSIETVAQPQGLVLPFLVVLGFYAGYKMIENVFRNTISLKSQTTKIFILIIIFFTLVMSYTLVGLIIYGNFYSLIINLSFVSGILGLAIAVYLVQIRKIKTEELFIKISYVYLAAIILNLAFSIYKVGIQQTFSRYMYAATPIGGIYHIWIYYPFIVASVFLFALPYWENNKLTFIPVYALVALYLMSLQVKGPIVLFAVGFLSYFIFFTKKYRTLKILGLVSSIGIILLVLPTQFLIGRFSIPGYSILSDREVIWVNFLKDISNNPIYLIRGSFTKSLTLSNDPLLGFNSLHNQYLEILDSYGIIIFTVFIIILFIYLIDIYMNVKKLKYHDNANIYRFWLFVVVLNMGIDLNTNVPLRVPNPSIILFFYWTSVYLLISREYRDKLEMNIEK